VSDELDAKIGFMVYCEVLSLYSPGVTKEDHWQPLRIVSQAEYLSNISQLTFTCKQICTPISETVFVACGGYLHYP
jgi:hypothetical protein